MAADAVEFDELGVVADFRKTRSQLALLFERKQDVCAHADNECTLEIQPLKPRVQ